MSPSVLLAFLLVAVWLTVASCSGRPVDVPTAPSEIASAAVSAETEPAPDPDPEQSPLNPPPAIPSPAPPLPTPPAEAAVLLGAGDITLCEAIHRAHATANLVETQLRKTGGIVITLGDNSNNDGRPEEYENCFRSTWGRFQLRPSPGNHDDYEDTRTNNGAAYFQFFGARAGPPNLGYYSFSAGTWHVISLNSEIMNRGPREDAQLSWLRADLNAHATAGCILAYFHRPMVSSGEFAAGRMARLWQVLYAAGVDVIVNGHEHFYERFAPQNPAGVADPAFGIRQFIVGTGGAHFHRSGARAQNSQLVIPERLGIIKFILRPLEYEWEFIDVNGGVVDRGSDRCHRKPN